MDNTAPESTPKSCSMSTCSFNFCFFAKLLVAIPALPFAAAYASTFFESPEGKALAMVGTVTVLIWAAVKVDHIPLLQKKVIKMDCKK